MKRLLPFLLLITSLSVFSQVPSYYNDVNLNQTGTALKDALATKIISTHTTNLSYTPGVWNALKQTDLDPNDPTKVILLYGYSDTDGNYRTDRTRSKDANGGSAGSQWNREHVYPKSLGNPNLGTSGPGADAHHLRACDISWNSTRSSLKFVSSSGNSGPKNGGWYPGDEWKGDVARMMMYMYLRYGSQCLPKNVANGSTVSSDSNMVQLFLQWNAEDPVSNFEKQRNPVLEGLQGNRNPFIDNPAFATQIWGGPQAEDLFGNGGGNGDTQAPTTPTNLTASNTTQTTVDLTWNASTDNVSVAGYRIYNGSTQVGTSTSTSFTVTSLTANTSYWFTVRAYDGAGNTSANSTSVSVTTQNGGNTGGGNGIASEVLISEYVEGSSYNKAIEIANFTGSSINLSNYTLKKASNGGGWPSSGLNLSGTLANGETYVVANSNASTTIKNKAQLTTSNSTLGFNGNDAIGLFKNNVLIDVIGNPTSSSYFAKDKTLQRKSSVNSPNSTYTSSEWNVLSKDTFNGLGLHSIDGGNTADTTAPTTPSNVSANTITQTSVNLTWTASTDNVAVTGYDVYRNSTKIATVTSTNYTVNGLTANTAYSFSVTAKDGASNTSAQSTAVSVTTLETPDTSAPTTPTNLTSSTITQTSVTLNWNASTDNKAVTGYDVYRNSTKITTVTSTSYTVNGLSANTSYSFYITAKDEALNVSANSSSITIKTLANVVSYCYTKGNNVNYEYIDNVVLGGISNTTSANGGYGNFTSQAGNINYGSNTIVVSAGFSSSSYTEFWKVWIDFNQNGTFESSEEVVSGSSSSSGNLSYSFNVPSSALTGATRMRVSMKWNGAPTPCETFSYGEVEDYTVNIGNTSARGGNVTAVQIDGELGNEAPVFATDVYPNPTANFINLAVKDNRELSYKIVNYIGQTVKQGNVDRNIDVRNLQTGMYIIEVNDGQRSFTKKFIKK